MASSFSKWRSGAEDDLQEQVARLSGEVAALSRLLSKRGAAAYADGRETAADLYDDLRERVIEAMPAVRRQARVVEKAARDNPTATAAVGLVVLGLLATMLLRRST